MRPLPLLLLAAVVAAGALAAPSVVASPATLANGDNVTVSWSGIVAPAATDVIRVYAPHGLLALGAVPVNTTAAWRSGAGTLTVGPLVNMRAPYSFAYETAAGSALALSNAVAVSAAEPVSVRLAFANASAFSVTWTSGSSAQVPQVQWGPSPSALRNTVSGSSATYALTDLCGAPANDTASGWREPGFFHTVVLDTSALAPGSTVYYRAGNAADGWTSVRSFRTAAAPAAPQPVKLLIFGDMGVQPPFVVNTPNDEQQPSLDTVAAMEQLRAASADSNWAAMHIGDISYARGYAFLWDFFHMQVEPLASTMAYMVGAGNHECDWPGVTWEPPFPHDYGTDSGGECGVPYQRRFVMPRGSGPASNALWYSFDHGPVHVVVCSSEHNFTEGSEQHNFIASDLAAVNRSVHPWLIFTVHRPFYTSASSSAGAQGTMGALRATFEPLFIKFHVNLCFVGHVHDYERTAGMLSNFTMAPTDAEGTIHVVGGNAGNTFQTDWIPEGPPVIGAGHHLQPKWVIFRTMNYGFCVVTASPSEFTFQMIGNARDLVHDSFTLTLS